LDLESLISKTIGLIGTYPPEELSSWAGISSLSVLKTSRRQELHPIIGDQSNSSIMLAEKLLQKQTKELEYRQREQLIGLYIKQHKSQVIGLGLALLVGASAILVGFYLGKTLNIPSQIHFANEPAYTTIYI